MDKLEHLNQLNRNWLADRPTIQTDNNDPMRVFSLLAHEVVEAREAIRILQENDDELVDDNLRWEVSQELADIMLFLLTTSDALGIDIYEATREKVAFNTARYEPKDYQGDMSYQEGRAITKKNEVIIYQQFYAD